MATDTVIPPEELRVMAPTRSRRIMVGYKGWILHALYDRARPPGDPRNREYRLTETDLRD